MTSVSAPTTPAGQSPDGWDDALDAFERSLAGQIAVLDGTAADAPEFVAPAGLGPLPARLRDRAVTLADQAARIGELLRASAADARARLDAPRPAETGRQSSFVDARG